MSNNAQNGSDSNLKLDFTSFKLFLKKNFSWLSKPYFVIIAILMILFGIILQVIIFEIGEIYKGRAMNLLSFIIVLFFIIYSYHIIVIKDDDQKKYMTITFLVYLFSLVFLTKLNTYSLTAKNNHYFIKNNQLVKKVESISFYEFRKNKQYNLDKDLLKRFPAKINGENKIGILKLNFVFDKNKVSKNPDLWLKTKDENVDKFINSALEIINEFELNNSSNAGFEAKLKILNNLPNFPDSFFTKDGVKVEISFQDFNP
jgi:hypothetical protein